VDRAFLIEQIRLKKSFLCIGLDTDIGKLPVHLLEEEDPVYEFNKAIIESTADLCVAYKPNTAFYEAQGVQGWNTLQKTIAYIPSDLFVIADAKRADIGNTSDRYAKAFFEVMEADAITLHPYMGYDSISPFLNYDHKWAIILALTSNTGSKDFQMLDTCAGSEKLFETVLKVTKNWAGPDKMMYVVGATHPESFVQIRNIVPDHFLLVPGIGAQGGSLSEVVRYGANTSVGLLVNASRSVLYASSGKDFADAARQEALKIQKEMAVFVDQILG
jgi:orotidine-5'-phosphate decarboxylase